ncbi:MAG: winged helix-turn-helix domain-containing protein [Ilumatobacteraceae bacterium]
MGEGSPSAPIPEAGRPAGTVTFLFTDVEGSTQLWSEDADAMSASLRVHDELVRAAIESNGGYVFTTAGDAFCSAFAGAAEAIAAARAIVRFLDSARWPGPALAVRIGLHLGDAESRDGDYFGPTVNAAARVCASGHGGQVLLTEAVRAIARPPDAVDLGTHSLGDHDEPIGIHQLGPVSFPPLHTDAGATVRRFDGFEVDLAARELRSGGDRVHIEPQVFDVLAYLVLNGDRLVSREELLDEVWGDQFVSLSALTSRIKSARQALGDDGQRQRYIRTERGRGYQFVGTLEAAAGVIEPPRTSTRSADVDNPLPAVANPLLGRDDELGDLAELLDGSGLVTVVGPGGVGKTRLAIEAARRWAESGRRRVSFVGLDSVRNEMGVAESLATTLRVEASAEVNPLVACAEWLASHDHLLVLDNCEHVLQAAADVVRELLDAAPDLLVLATSREPLRLRSEHLLRLTTLPVPPAESPVDPDDDLGPTVELFCSRARQSDRTFRLTADTVTSVVELCRGLDGLPLAVELAAGRLGTLGVADLAESLGGRLDLIRSQSRDLPDRHRSLRSTIEWSHRLLHEDAQRLFACLARFPGGLALSDVEVLMTKAGIDARSDDVVSQLVDASVIVRVGSAGRTRFRMLDTLREYGIEQLEALALCDVADDALVDHALEVARRERSAWTSGSDQRGRRVVGRRDEIPNLRAARDVMLERFDVESLVELSAGLVPFTEEVCLAELWRWHEELPALTAELIGPVRNTALMLDAIASRNRGDLEHAEATLIGVLDADIDTWTRARALHALAMVRLFRGELDEAADLWLELDALTGMLRGTMFAAMCAAFGGDVAAAREYFDRCHSVLDEPVPIEIVVNYHFVAGEIARVAGDPSARASLERSVGLAKESDLYFSHGVAHVTLMSILVEQGETVAAAEGFVELIERWLRSNTWPQAWTTLRNAAELLSGVDDRTCLLIWAAAHHDEQAPALDHDAAEHERELRDAAVERVGDGEAQQIEEFAGRMPRPEAAEQTMASLSALVD